MGAKKKAPTFGEALAEVEAILARLENDEVDIDELSAEVKRAVELIQVCREKLQRTEMEVGEFVAGLQEEETPSQAEGPAAGENAPGETNGEEDLPF